MHKNKYLAIDSPPILVKDHLHAVDVSYGDFLSKGTESPAIYPGMPRIKEMYHANFSMQEFKGEFQQPAMLANQGGTGLDHVGICLFIKGEVESFLLGQKGVHSPSFNNSQNYKYDPSNECVHLVPANKPFHIAHFSVKDKFFKTLLPPDEKWADLLQTTVDKRQLFIGEKFRPIQAAQMAALKNIYDCPLSGKLGDMMIETSVVQVILLQMHALFNDAESRKRKMSKRDIDLACAVKDYLNKHVLDDHSLTSLARQFCTNRTKLMGLFKQYFGKSIFDHISDERMNYARKMLYQGDQTVSEIAYTLGYKNPNHFSTAFKRKFLVSPSQVRG